ncbi:unnamed protein product [Linum tenue]|nr:unnamed protein product [Linum tenue]
MSCPHLVRVGALIKKAHPDWSPATILTVMMKVVNSLDLSNQPIKDAGKSERTSTAFGIGVGHVNPNKALHPRSSLRRQCKRLCQLAMHNEFHRQSNSSHHTIIVN